MECAVLVLLTQPKAITPILFGMFVGVVDTSRSDYPDLSLEILVLVLLTQPKASAPIVWNALCRCS